MIDEIVEKAVAATVFFILLSAVVITQYQDARDSLTDNPELAAFLLLVMLLLLVGVGMKFYE